MIIASRKIVWWNSLAAGVGGTALFAYFAISEPPILNAPKFFIWPVVTVLFAIFAAVRLRRCYQKEPCTPCFWHMSITDMLLAAMITGILMMLFQAGHAQNFVAVSVPLSLFIGVHYVAGVLTATHLGIAKFGHRHVYSFFFVLRTFGAMGVASCVVLFILVSAYNSVGAAVKFLCQMVIGGPDLLRDHELLILYFMRASFVALPIGIFGCRRMDQKKIGEAYKA